MEGREGRWAESTADKKYICSRFEFHIKKKKKSMRVEVGGWGERELWKAEAEARADLTS